jgi:hypothetical protein
MVRILQGLIVHNARGRRAGAAAGAAAEQAFLDAQCLKIRLGAGISRLSAVT